MENTFLRLPQLSLISGVKRHTLNARLKTSFNGDFKRNPSNQILLNPAQTRLLIEDRIQNNIGKIIYVGNLKGGVGKTTISYLLSCATSSIGLKTCVLDLDVQSNLTRQFLPTNIDYPVFYDVIDKKKKIDETIVEISDVLHLIPSSLRNSLIQKALTIQSPKHHLTWFNSICLNYLRENYEVIIVDTPPHLTTLNSVFCLCLTGNDYITIPVCAEDFSIMGVQMFLEDVLEIRNSYEVDSSVNVTIIMNRFFQNQKNNLELLVKMGSMYQKMLSNIIIRDNAKIREIMNDRISLGNIKQGKEIYELVSNLLHEFKIIG